MRASSSDPFSSQPSTQDIRDAIVTLALPEVPFDGWTWPLIEQAAQKAGYQASMAASVFPGGLPDVLAHFADLADRWMLARLAEINPDELRVRERVQVAVMARFRALYQYRDAVRQAATFWLAPTRAARGGKMTWRTADRIWQWAGDTATDYNHYTKRSLLCGVLVSTTLAWFDDDSAGMLDTEKFLERRIAGVLTAGKFIGQARSSFPFSFFKRDKESS